MIKIEYRGFPINSYYWEIAEWENGQPIIYDYGLGYGTCENAYKYCMKAKKKYDKLIELQDYIYSQLMKKAKVK